MKVLFVSMRGIGKRTKFAKEQFDKMTELEAKWMMSVHGQGRWPTSRCPLSSTKMTASITPEESSDAEYIILMDTNPPDWRDSVLYNDKIQHWHVEKGLPWEEQEVILMEYVRRLASTCSSYSKS